MPPTSDPFRASLFARIGGRKPDYKGKKRDAHAFAEAARAVLERLGGQDQAQLVQLWRNWSMVMGPDIADLAIPLGSRKRVLLVGGEDNMSMQELTYQIPEMLERANAFMASDHFERVELHLLLGRAALDARIATADVPSGSRSRPQPPCPERLGGLQLDPGSAVGRCYAAYLKFFKR